MYRYYEDETQLFELLGYARYYADHNLDDNAGADGFFNQKGLQVLLGAIESADHETLKDLYDDLCDRLDPESAPAALADFFYEARLGQAYPKPIPHETAELKQVLSNFVDTYLDAIQPEVEQSFDEVLFNFLNNQQNHNDALSRIVLVKEKELEEDPVKILMAIQRALRQDVKALPEAYGEDGSVQISPPKIIVKRADDRFCKWHWVCLIIISRQNCPKKFKQNCQISSRENLQASNSKI